MFLLDHQINDLLQMQLVDPGGRWVINILMIETKKET
jgi:hypothetical protein